MQSQSHTLSWKSILLLFLVVAATGGCKKNSCTDCDKNAITLFKLLKADNTNLPQDVNFTIDESNGNITGTLLKWIPSENPADLIPYFETDGKTVKVDGAIQTTHVTNNNFKLPLTYSVIAQNGSERKYTVNLVCPQVNASLPVLKIDADGAITSKETYVTANLNTIGNGVTDGLWDSYASGKKIEIRLRGNSTAFLPKKPYRMKFPDKFSPLGLNHAKEKNWVLLANDADKTLLRNAIAFQASRIMDDNAAQHRFTPATTFVDVYLNANYEGNYMLTDQLEVAPGRINIESLKASDGADPAKITGGYFLEIDGFGASEPLFFYTPQKNMTVVMKYPKDDDYAAPQFDYIKDYVGNKAEGALFAGNFTDPVQGWRGYFDSKTWVDYYIINEFTGNPDAWWSTNVYKHRNDPLLYFGPVWDFDIAFNNDIRLGDATRKLMATDAHDPRQWIQQFILDPGFKAAVKTRWNAKKTELKALTSYVDELAAKINISQQANFMRWNIQTQSLGHGGTPPSSYKEGITQLKNYLDARYSYLEGVFSAW